MNVSEREESLAQELYELDMSNSPGSFVPWDRQISYVKTHYKLAATRVVNSKWFKKYGKQN